MARRATGKNARVPVDRTGFCYRFGKHPPKGDYRTLHFKKYLGLATPPAAASTLQKVYVKLGKSDPTVLFPTDASDHIQDCTIAAAAHAITVFSGLQGATSIMPEQDVVKLYYQMTGGLDSGLPALDVLNYWQSNGINGSTLFAFARIDPKNHDHVMMAIATFGGVYTGFHVQANCVQAFRSRQPWTPGSLTTSGHAVFAVDYDQVGLTVLTWGNTQLATWEWWDECVDEAYALIPSQMTQVSGLDINALTSDLAAVAT